MHSAPKTDAASDVGVLFPGTRAERRRLIARTSARILLTTAGLLLLYAFVPIPGESGAGPLLGMLAGFVVFLVLAGSQIRSIVGADHPVLRAVEVISFSIPLLVVVFAFTYLSLSQNDPGSFSEDLDRVDAIYYAVSTISTVGPGDITPETSAARLLVTAQMLFNLVLVAFVVRLAILSMRTGLQRRGLDDGLGEDD